MMRWKRATVLRVALDLALRVLYPARSLCNLRGLCALVVIFLRNSEPPRHGGHRGSSEKRLESPFRSQHNNLNCHEDQRHERRYDEVNSIGGVVIPSARTAYSSFTMIIGPRLAGGTF